MSMISSSRFLICATWLLSLVGSTETDVFDQLYVEMPGQRNACVRRSNSTSAVGCQSSEGGQSGILFLIDVESDIHEFLKIKDSWSYIVVFRSLGLLTSSNVMKLSSTNRLNGILVLKTNLSDVESYSSQGSCPNEWLDRGGAMCSVQWNPRGTDLFNLPLDFPIVYLSSDENSRKVLDCYKNLNAGEKANAFPLCSAWMDTFMYSSGSSEVCMRRTRQNQWINAITSTTMSSQCSPLGGLNVFGQLYSQDNQHPYTKTVVIAARADTVTYLYDMENVGADAYGSGLVALLGVVEALRPFESQFESRGFNVLFILFDGEFFDNSGSLRAVYDMGRGQFPVDPSLYDSYPALLTTSDISAYIELGQLVSSPSDGQLFVHPSDGGPEAERVVNALISASSSVSGLSVSNSSVATLPPCSIYSFLRSNSSFSGVLLTSYDAEYDNRFYGDALDLPERFGMTATVETGPQPCPYTNTLKKTSRVVAQAVLDVVGVPQSAPEPSNTEEYSYCLLINTNCTTLRRFTEITVNKAEPLSRYVSIADNDQFGTSLVGVRALLQDALKVPADPNNTRCQPPSQTDASAIYFSLYSEDWEESGCWKAPVAFSEAQSPAFLTHDFQLYPAWTESYWADLFVVKLYATGDPTVDMVALAVGVMVAVVSFGVVIFIRVQSDILFHPDSSRAPGRPRRMPAGSEESELNTNISHQTAAAAAAADPPEIRSPGHSSFSASAAGGGGSYAVAAGPI